MLEHTWSMVRLVGMPGSCLLLIFLIWIHFAVESYKLQYVMCSQCQQQLHSYPATVFSVRSFSNSKFCVLLSSNLQFFSYFSRAGYFCGIRLTGLGAFQQLLVMFTTPGALHLQICFRIHWIRLEFTLTKLYFHCSRCYIY